MIATKKRPIKNMRMNDGKKRILLFANTDWYLFNFRLSFIEELVRRKYEVVLITPAGKYSHEFIDRGLHWVAAPLSRGGMNPFTEFAMIVWLIRFIRSEEIDLVHGFTIKCAVYGALAARFCRIPRVSAIAGLGYVFSSSSFRAKAIRPLVELAMCFSFKGRSCMTILQNPDDARFLLDRRLVAPANVAVIRSSGVDCEKFKPQKQKSTNSNKIKVLLASRMLWEKGIAEYLESAAKLVKELDCQFYLAGEADSGNPASVPMEYIETYSKRGIVHWLGKVSDMSALYGSVDIAVLPSYYGEGVPKTLIEAASAGLPIVSTDMPGCREAVIQGSTGFLVEPKNVEELSLAIEKLIVDKSLRASFGKAARSLAQENFDHKIIFEATLEVYQDLLEFSDG